MEKALLATSRGKRLIQYLGGAGIIAVFCSFLAYAAAVSIAALFRLEGVNPRKIATDAFYISGAFASMGALLLLALRG